MVIDTEGESPRVLYSAQWKIEVGEELVEDGKITSTNEYGALTEAIKKIDDSIHVLARFSEGKKELECRILYRKRWEENINCQYR